MPTQRVTESLSLYCPLCEKSFFSPSVKIPNISARESIDGYKETRETYLEYQVHTCRVCGFSGDLSFINELSPDEDGNKKKLDSFNIITTLIELEDLILEINPEKTFPGCVKYALFALCLQNLEGRTTRQVAEAYMNAAWCAMEDPQHHDLEWYYRRQAAMFFELALAEDEADANSNTMTCQFHKQDRPAVALRIAEQYRQTADRFNANIWYRRAIKEARGLNNKKIEAAAKIQMVSPIYWKS